VHVITHVRIGYYSYILRTLARSVSVDSDVGALLCRYNPAALGKAAGAEREVCANPRAC
jgi:hypothetical protein